MKLSGELLLKWQANCYKYNLVIEQNKLLRFLPQLPIIIRLNIIMETKKLFT